MIIFIVLNIFSMEMILYIVIGNNISQLKLAIFADCRSQNIFDRVQVLLIFL